MNVLLVGPQTLPCARRWSASPWRELIWNGVSWFLPWGPGGHSSGSAEREMAVAVEVCRRSACGPRGPKPLQFSPALPQHALVPVARAQLVLAPTVVVGGGSGWGRHRGQGQVLALPRKVLECIVLEPGYVAMPSHLEDGKGVRAPHGPACSCTFLPWGWREAAEAGSSPASAQQTVLGEQAAVARCLRRQTTSLPPPAGGGLAETGSSTLVCLGQSMLRAQDGLCQ